MVPQAVAGSLKGFKKLLVIVTDKASSQNIMSGWWKASKWLKKTGFLGTDDLQLMTINYNNEESINDLEAVDFNNDIQMSDVNDTDLKKKLQQHNRQVKQLSESTET